jgi:multidrug efflux pump subunit AcrA (membrane-fusion protein)
MKRRQYVIISLIIIFISLIAWSLYTNYQSNANKKKETKVNLQYAKVIEVQNGVHNITIIGFGRVNTALSITISPEVAGVVMHGNSRLKQGLKFSKGSILFKIDDREAQLSLKARKSSFLNLMAGALADINIDYPASYEKWKQFFESLNVDKKFPNLPESSSPQEKTFLASRNVLSEYYNIKKDEIRLSKYTIRAPFTGYFAQVMVQEGSFVGMGTPVATLSKTSEIEIAVPIDKENIAMVKIDQSVKMKTRGSDIEWEGKVKRIEQQLNVNTQSINVYVEPLQESDKLYPGMYLEVTINSGEIPNSVELPRKALGDRGIVSLIQDSILNHFQVEVIQKNKNSYIVKGLKTGDLVVTEQMPNVQEGQKIVPVK